MGEVPRIAVKFLNMEKKPGCRELGSEMDPTI